MTTSGVNSGTLVSFIDQKSQTIYSWLDYVTACNLPFSFCEDPTVAKYTTMKTICSETLLKYAVLLTKEVEMEIADILPASFGVMLDGWSFQSEHYVAVFAVFEHDQRSEKVLLALAPIVDEKTEDQSAESHVLFLRGILPFFKRDTASICFLVADNCSVNTRLADLLQVPFIGCASYRLNLAVKLYLLDDEPLMEQLQQLMLKLRCLSKAAALRKKTDLRPVLRQTTRWTSTFKIDRYLAIRSALDTDDDDVVALMPTRRQEKRLQELRSDFGDFQSATMKLQEDHLTILDVRDIFDALVVKHPVVDKYLAADASIVKSPAFEEACVLTLTGKDNELTGEQELMLLPFETVPEADTGSEDAGTARPQGFANQVLEARKKQRTARKKFRGVEYIPPTSNTVEELFSIAKHTLSLHHHGMLPRHLETVLFLKLNMRFWKAATVAKVVHAQ